MSYDPTAELLLLVDLCLLHWCDQEPGRQLPSKKEGTVRLRYGTLHERKLTPNAPGERPRIRRVEIYSEIYAPAKWALFDDVESAVAAARDWYEHAKSLAS